MATGDASMMAVSISLVSRSARCNCRSAVMSRPIKKWSCSDSDHTPVQTSVTACRSLWT
jgi:hypothetical protein